MATALNAFMLLGDAGGESKQMPGWIELQAWDWEVEAETSWTKGGGAAVGKPSPGKMNWEHPFDRSSNIVLANICTGKSFPEVKLEMYKSTGKSQREKFFWITMTEAFITKVTQSATDEGNVTQKVEMVFKTIVIEYKPQGKGFSGSAGGLGAGVKFDWDIPAGVAHPDSYNG
ncbi:MAG: type VI secretion system tube protein Hcp [Caldimonas sp.]